MLHIPSHRRLSDGVLIIWEWVDYQGSGASDDVEENSESNVSSTDGEPEGGRTESTLPFKCIGVTRDASYQVLLRELKDRLDKGENLDIKLVPEPHNPYD